MALGIFATAVGDPVVLILALTPAPLVAERVARAFYVREETVGALTAATVFLSFPLLVALVPGLAPTANMGLFGFVLGALFAGALPRIRDVALPVLDGARYVASAALLGAAALSGPSLFDGSATLMAAGTLAIGTVTAAIAARAFGGDAGAAAVGGGLRDASVCAGLALVSGLAGAAPLVVSYAGLVLVAAALRKLLVSDEARREPLGQQGQRRGDGAGG